MTARRQSGSFHARFTLAGEPYRCYQRKTQACRRINRPPIHTARRAWGDGVDASRIIAVPGTQRSSRPASASSMIPDLPCAHQWVCMTGGYVR